MKTGKSAILITGAGSGIGRGIAQVLAQRNKHSTLILAGRTSSSLEETRKLLPSAENHHVLLLDLTKNTSIKEMKEYLVNHQMTLESMVLNAGIGGENEYGSHDRWDDIIATNLTGPYQLTQELMPLLKASTSEYKSIVFVSSILARLGVPKYSAYCASKSGLLGLMRSLAAEHASDKVLINAICPGWVETEMSVRGFRDIADANKISVEKAKQGQMSMVPLGKMSSPSEVAELVHFLISGIQTSITGQTIDINNGAVMP